MRPTTFKKYLRYVVCGEEFADLKDVPDKEPYNSELDDKGFEVSIIDYDAIRFYVGYNKDRDSMLVRVNNSILQFFEDEEGEPVYYEHKGAVYIASQMIYQLGEVLEKDFHPKKH